MKEIAKRCWQIYRRSFKDGESVVLEDDTGTWRWGRLKTHEWGVTLTRPDGRFNELDWEEIVFMGHEGFPVSAIMGMTYAQAEKFCDVTPTQLLRDKFRAMCNVEASARWVDEDKGEEGRKDEARRVNAKFERPYRSTVTFGGGCPFVFENVTPIALHFPGNNGPHWWGEDGEEELILESRDGARLHSYDLSHLFLFDGLKI